MADIFTKNDAQQVVESRIIWLLGDSNMRAIYKDLVWLVQKNTLIDLSSLRNKLEDSYMNDCLIKGKKIHKGRNYIEVRCFEDHTLATKIEFTFITECLSDDILDKIMNLRPSDTPDVIVINSCLWDLTRWGPNGVIRYKQNVRGLLQHFKTHLPSDTLVIWTTTPPISSEPFGGFLIKQIHFMKPFLRFEVMEANFFMREEMVRYGFDLLDIHYHLLLQIHRRRPDGIHWNPDAVRHMTNLLLTHIALALCLPLPGNFSSQHLDKMIHFDRNRSDINNNVIEGKINASKLASNTVIPTTVSREGLFKNGFQSSFAISNTTRNGKTKKSKKHRRERNRRLKINNYKTQCSPIRECYRKNYQLPLVVEK